MLSLSSTSWIPYLRCVSELGWRGGGGGGGGGVDGTVGSVAELNCTIQELDCFFLFHQHHAAWGTFPLICVGVGGWIYIDHSTDGLFFLFHQHHAVCYVVVVVVGIG